MSDLNVKLIVHHEVIENLQVNPNVSLMQVRLNRNNYKA